MTLAWTLKPKPEPSSELSFFLAKRPFVQTHRYRAEEFGLTDDMIAERFGTYMQHFQIERERSAPRP